MKGKKMVLPIGVAMGLNFTSGLLGGIAKSNEAKKLATGYKQNAAYNRYNAAQTRLRGAMDEDAMRKSNRSHLAQSSAVMAEAGMGESATATSALATAASGMEQNVLNKRYQTEAEAENLLYQARLEDAKARAAKKKSRNMFRSGLINGISSALNVYLGGD